MVSKLKTVKAGLPFFEPTFKNVGCLSPINLKSHNKKSEL